MSLVISSRFERAFGCLRRDFEKNRMRYDRKIIISDPVYKAVREMNAYWFPKVTLNLPAEDVELE